MMKVVTVNERSHDFPTATVCGAKKYTEKRTLTTIKGAQHWISTEAKMTKQVG